MTTDTHITSGRHRGRRNGRRTASSKGLVRAAFSQVVVRARYQVRGSAGGFITFRESGNLTLTAPTVFLTSRLSLILPPPPPLSPPRPATAPHRLVSPPKTHTCAVIYNVMLPLFLASITNALRCLQASWGPGESGAGEKRS